MTCFFFYCLLKGLKYLHERKNPIIHRDLSDKNVLLLKDGTVKISDLGQAKLLDNRSQFLMTTQPGTVAYLPPEALKTGGEYTAKVDAFSLGVLILEISTQHQPQVELMGIGTTPEMFRREKDLKKLSDKHVIKPLIVWCFQDSEMRPDVATVYSHVSTFVSVHLFVSVLVCAGVCVCVCVCARECVRVFVYVCV